MLGDLRIDEITPDRSESRQGALLVDSHQPRVADDIGTQDDGKPMLYYPRLRHCPGAPGIQQVNSTA